MKNHSFYQFCPYIKGETRYIGDVTSISPLNFARKLNVFGSRDVNIPVIFGEQTKLAYKSHDIRSRFLNFPAKFSGETELVYRSRDMNFSADFGGEI